MRLFACGRVVLGLFLALCSALRATSTQLLVLASRHDGGRTVACQHFTGTRVVQWQLTAGSGRQGCPLVRRG